MDYPRDTSTAVPKNYGQPTFSNRRGRTETTKATQVTSTSDPAQTAVATYNLLLNRVTALLDQYQSEYSKPSSQADPLAKENALASFKEAYSHLEMFRKISKERFPQCLEFYLESELEEMKRSSEKKASSKGGFELNLHLPALQIVGSAKWHADRCDHTSVENFLCAFEEELKLHGLSLDNYWPMCIPACLNSAQTVWFDATLKGQEYLSWKVVRQMILDKFETPEQKLKSMEAVLKMTQKPGEGIEQYVHRFQQAAHKAGLAKYNLPLSACLLSSLEQKALVYNYVTKFYGHLFFDKPFDDVCVFVAHLPLDNPLPTKRPATEMMGNKSSKQRIDTSRDQLHHNKLARSTVSALAEKQDGPSQSLCRYGCGQFWHRKHRCEEGYREMEKRRKLRLMSA